MLLISVVLSLLILLVTLASLIIKRTGYEGKAKERVEKFKKSIFFNMIISQILVNALKCYIIGFMSFHMTDSDVGSKSLGAVILSIYIALPFFFARLLYKRQEELKDQEQIDKIGKLYEYLVTVTALN